MPENSETAAPIHGRRNLLLLGAGAVLLAGITTGVELWVYRSSGDIYLDRSRPGYLPDTQEAEEEAGKSPTYSFPETGELNKAELEKYLTELKSVQSYVKRIEAPYGPDALTDEALGLTTEAI